MSNEKREFQRFTVEVHGEVEIDGDVVAAATNDVSKGGCGLIVDRPVPEGGQVRITLFLTQDGIEDPDEDPFETVAKVMWMAPRDDGSYAAGLQFGNLSPAREMLLAHFLHAIS